MWGCSKAIRPEGISCEVTAQVNTAGGILCRAVAEKLPETVQKVEPTLEDAYVYLGWGRREAAMTVWRDLRVEWMRLFRSKGTWLALLAASAAPLVGYGLISRRGQYNRDLGSSESPC